jgi:hypothetical protein
MPKRNLSPTAPAAKRTKYLANLDVDFKLLSLVNINLIVILYKNTKKHNK